MLLQPDDSLQILAPVEADVGFYVCNASNALGSDSVSIAVTLAGNGSLSVIAQWCLPLVCFWRGIVCRITAGSGRWLRKVVWQRYKSVKVHGMCFGKPWGIAQFSQTVHDICVFRQVISTFSHLLKLKCTLKKLHMLIILTYGQCSSSSPICMPCFKTIAGLFKSDRLIQELTWLKVKVYKKTEMKN